MFPRIAVLVLALTVLAPGARANEFDMGRRVLGQMHRAQDLHISLQNMALYAAGHAAPRDPKLKAEIEALQKRVGDAYERMQGQYRSLLGVNVAGDPNVINDRVKSWVYRKTAMSIYLLGATGDRNETRLNRLAAEAAELEKRLGGSGTLGTPRTPGQAGAQYSLLGLKAR